MLHLGGRRQSLSVYKEVIFKPMTHTFRTHRVAHEAQTCMVEQAHHLDQLCQRSRKFCPLQMLLNEK